VAVAAVVLILVATAVLVAVTVLAVSPAPGTRLAIPALSAFEIDAQTQGNDGISIALALSDMVLSSMG